MKEPKNCPYCGSNPEIRIHNDKLEDPELIRYSVDCMNFCCSKYPSVGYYRTNEEAVNAWNDMIEKIKEMAQNE